MKTNKRMNLFSGLVKSESPKLELKKIKVGVYTYFMAAGLILFCAVLIPKYFNFKKELKNLANERADLENQIAAKVKESEERAERIAQKKAAVAQALKDGNERAPAAVPSSSLDGTWTAILWKLITFADEVTVDKILMGSGDNAAPQNGPNFQNPADSMQGQDGKMVTLEGNASSLGSLTRWIELLSQNLPASVFSVEKQSVVNDKNFPITFKLVARVL